jgi:hypothetical protein
MCPGLSTIAPIPAFPRRRGKELGLVRGQSYLALKWLNQLGQAQ